MGPVSSITTAPVSIGNAIRGSSASARRIKNGVRITGRDFCFTALQTAGASGGNITTWCMAGGTPLTPGAFIDSNLRQQVQVYQKFKWNKCTVHYITSSSTATTGDVLFYYQKNRNSVFLSQTSNNLLPFVMSDTNCVMGPQWQNLSLACEIKPEWKSTDYGMSSQLDYYSAGDLFLLSNTTSTDSPGYVIMDYEIDFAEEQISPRLAIFPIFRIQWWNMALYYSGSTLSQYASIPFISGGGTAKSLANIASAYPANTAVGDVFKIIIDATNSPAPTGQFTAILHSLAASNVIQNQLSVMDGTTLYATVFSPTQVYLYMTAEEAFASTNPIATNVAISMASTLTLEVWMSYIGNCGGTYDINPTY